MAASGSSSSDSDDLKARNDRAVKELMEALQSFNIVDKEAAAAASSGSSSNADEIKPRYDRAKKGLVEALKSQTTAQKEVQKAKAQAEADKKAREQAEADKKAREAELAISLARQNELIAMDEAEKQRKAEKDTNKASKKAAKKAKKNEKAAKKAMEDGEVVEEAAKEKKVEATDQLIIIKEKAKKPSKKERDRAAKKAAKDEEAAKKALEDGEAAKETEREKKVEAIDRIIQINDNYSIQMSMDKSTLKGFMSNAFGTIRVSGIDYGFDVDGSLEELWSLSTSHESLLSILTCTTSPSTDTPLLVVEEVSSFHDYCEEIVMCFLEKPDHTRRAWWPFIAETYRTLFRDGVVALTFLYVKKKRSCGNLLHNFYVTKDGRGRILPGRADKARKDEDINAFISLMKRLLLGPFIEADDSWLIENGELNIPTEVKHFFAFAPLHRALPLEYLLHHPSVWSFSQLIYYPARLKKVLYKRSNGPRLCGAVLDEVLTNMAVFANWNVKLYGVYTAIWEKGDPKKSLDFLKEDRELLESLGAIKISAYKGTVSIVRYFAAAIQHYNDKPYYFIRPKELTDPEIVQELRAIFPDFYTAMYEALGKCVAVRGTIGTNILAALGTIDEKADDFPELAST